ncbi:MAG: hypothetical protein Tsb0010_14150 [Parvularculaceae bacterium]
MTEQIRTLLDEARVARKRGDASMALATAKRALALVGDGAADADLTARIHCAIGQFERDLNDLENSARSYARGVSNFEKSANATAKAHALRHQGDLERLLGRLDAAESLVCEAISIYRDHEMSDEIAMANAERVLALVRDAQGRSRKARKSWLDARKIYAMHKIDSGVAECDERLASL